MAVAQRQYYIARNTTIPVPRVLDVLGVRGYIPHSAGIHRYARPLMCGTRWQHAMPQLLIWNSCLRYLLRYQGKFKLLMEQGCPDDRLHARLIAFIDKFNTYFLFDADLFHLQNENIKRECSMEIIPPWILSLRNTNPFVHRLHATGTNKMSERNRR